MIIGLGTGLIHGYTGNYLIKFVTGMEIIWFIFYFFYFFVFYYLYNEYRIIINWWIISWRKNK